MTKSNSKLNPRETVRFLVSRPEVAKFGCLPLPSGNMTAPWGAEGGVHLMLRHQT